MTLLVIYLKAVLKDPGRCPGDKYLCLVLLNSLMRSENEFLLRAVDSKLLRRLYLLLAAEEGVLKHSKKRPEDRKGAAMFQQLLR